MGACPSATAGTGACWGCPSACPSCWGCPPTCSSAAAGTGACWSCPSAKGASVGKKISSVLSWDVFGGSNEHPGGWFRRPTVRKQCWSCAWPRTVCHQHARESPKLCATYAVPGCNFRAARATGTVLQGHCQR